MSRLAGVIAFVLLALGISVPVAFALESDGATRVSADAFQFDALKGGTVGDPFNTGDMVAMVRAAEAEHEKAIATKAAQAERAKSIDAFAGLGRSAAISAVVDAFSDSLKALTTLPSEPLLLSESPPKFNAGSDTSARVDPPGPEDSRLVVSSLPLRNKDGQIVSGRLEPTQGGFEPKDPLAKVELPRNADGEVELADVGVEFSFTGAENSVGQLVDAGEAPGKEMVFYPNTHTDTDTAVTYTLQGIETFNYLRSAESPERLSLDYALPQGGEIKATADGGAVVLDSEGDLLVTVLPPFSVDAQGTDVPTELSVDGDSINLEVPHRGEDFAYPIMVDPVQHVRNWWGNGSSPGFESWTFYQEGTSNYNSSLTCPNNLATVDPCPGTGAGVYASAVPTRTYPAGSKGYWRWVAPGGASSSITDVVIDSWRFRKGSSSPGWAFYSLYNVNNATSYTQNITDGSGGSGLTLYGGSSGYKYLHSGLMTGSASTIPSGASNWRYNRIGAYTATLTDGEPPSLNLTGAPAGWLKPNTAFNVAANAHDPGLGMSSIQAFNQDWQAKWIGWCTGTFPTTCPTNAFTASMAFDSNQFSNGRWMVPVKATDIVGGSNHETTTSFDIRIDGEGPSITKSGPLSQGSTPGDQITIQVDDHALTSPTFDGSGNVTPTPNLLQYTRLRSGAKDFKLYVDNQLVSTQSRTCASNFGSCRLGPFTLQPDLSEFDDGVHDMKIVATDQAGNSTTETWVRQFDSLAPAVRVSSKPTGWVTDPTFSMTVSGVDTMTGDNTDSGNGIKKFIAKKGNTQVGSSADLNCSPACPKTASGVTLNLNSSLIGDGLSEVDVFAVGPHGEEGVPVHVPVKVDHDVPDAVVTAPTWAGSKIDVDVEAENVGSGISEVIVKAPDDEILGSTEVDCAAGCPETVETSVEVDTSELDEGNRNLTLVVKAAAGNSGSQQFLVKVDHTAPDLSPIGGSITSIENVLTTREDTVTLTTGAVETGTHQSGLVSLVVEDYLFETWSDSRDCTTINCASGTFNVPLGDLQDGEQAITVSATDKAGNREELEINLLLDRSKPEISIGTASPTTSDWQNGEDLEFHVNAEDNPISGPGLSSVETEVDGNSVAEEPCTEDCETRTYVVENIGEGEHEVEVVAEDTVGNDATATQTFNVDQTPPEVDLSGDLDGDVTVGSGAKTLEVEADEPASSAHPSGVSFATVSVDGDEVDRVASDCSSGSCPPLEHEFSLDESKLTFGAHKVVVHVGDRAGNVTTNELNVTRQCNVGAPTTVQTTAPAAPSAVVSTIEDEHPAVVEPSETVERNGDTFTPTLVSSDSALNGDNTAVESQISESADGQSVVGSGFEALCLVPDKVGEHAGEAVVVAGDSAVYPNTDQDADTVVRPTVEGSETFVILRSDQAPEEYTWNLGLSGEADVVAAPNGDVLVKRPVDELTAPEQPDDLPATEGLVEELVEAEELPAGTRDADPDPAKTALDDTNSTLEGRPDDGLIEDNLPAVPEVDGSAPAPNANPTLAEALSDVEDSLEEAGDARDALAQESLETFDDMETLAASEADDRGEQITADSVAELEGQDYVSARISAPKAEDADGEPVPIGLSTDGSSVTMEVDHQAGSFDYPIAADPWVEVTRKVLTWKRVPVYRDEAFILGREYKLRQIGWWNSANCKKVRCIKGEKPKWWRIPNDFRVYLPNGIDGSMGAKYEGYWKPVWSKRKVFSHWTTKKVLVDVTEKVWRNPPAYDPENDPADDAELDDNAFLQKAAVSRRVLPSRWFAGMNVVSFGPEDFCQSGKPNINVFDALKKQTGTDTVVLVPFYYVDNNKGERVFHAKKKSSSFECLEKAAKIAANKRNKLRVIIKPQVDNYAREVLGKPGQVPRTDLRFNGSGPNYDPDLRTAGSQLFWTSYRRMMVKYAKLAKRVKAKGLVIGTELTHVQWQNKQWRATIKAIQQDGDYCKNPAANVESRGCHIYYASNWYNTLYKDGNTSSTRLWPNWWTDKAVSGIGIDYYPDSDGAPTPAGMYEQMRALHASPAVRYGMKGKRIFFMEAGAQSYPGANKPTQEEFYKSIFDATLANQSDKWFRGIWWWDKWADGRGYDSYTPKQDPKVWDTVDLICQYQCPR